MLPVRRCPRRPRGSAVTRPCVPSARRAQHQGRGLHRVLGHRHCPLALLIPVRRVLHRGVLPAALAGGRRSQVSAAPTKPSGGLGSRDRASCRARLHPRDYFAYSAQGRNLLPCAGESKGQALICGIRLRHKNTSFLFSVPFIWGQSRGDVVLSAISQRLGGCAGRGTQSRAAPREGG